MNHALWEASSLSPSIRYHARAGSVPDVGWQQKSTPLQIPGALPAVETSTRSIYELTCSGDEMSRAPLVSWVSVDNGTSVPNAAPINARRNIQKFSPFFRPESVVVVGRVSRGECEAACTCLRD